MAFPPAVFFLLLFILHLSPSLSSLAPTKEGFSVELIHRESPRSPFYNPADTRYDRLRASIHLSQARADYFHQALSLPAAAKGAFQSKLIPNTKSYLMTIKVGTPPSKIVAVVDTGSDITWTDCKPCRHCYKQIAPLFDPTKSSTYHYIPCKAKTCSQYDRHGCRRDGSMCTFDINYADGSHTFGYLASETFTFDTKGGHKIEIPNISFGCSHDSRGTFSKRTAGIVGLDGNSLSLVSQLGSYMEKKFSYCFVPFDADSSTGLLTLGATAAASNPHAVSVPLVYNQYKNTPYSVLLEALGVGDEKPFPVKGNVMVDSGTTLTYLGARAVQHLTTSLLAKVPYRRVKDPDGVLDLCYDVGGQPNASFPDITLQFKGAAVKLGKLDTFLEVQKGIMCLGILGSNDDRVMILGSAAQRNVHVGFDLVENKLYFAPTDCTKL